MKPLFSLSGLLLALLWASHAVGGSPTETLDALHRAGVEGDTTGFISLLDTDAVILGLPGNSRLTGKALRDYISDAMPAGGAWTFRGGQRDIRYSADGAVAWFDEVLAHDEAGRGWGSGVLVRTGADWKVAQYSLSFAVVLPVPAASTAPAATATPPAEPVETQECKRLRHKTNKVSRC